MEKQNLIPNLEKRFHQRYEIKENDCWEWQGSLMPNGYGRIAFGVDYQYAHRVSWFLFHGYFSKKLICHKCDNRQCVNPNHLFEGTPKENTKDALKKGRLARGERHGKSFLSKKQVLQIRKSTKTQYQLSEEFGVSQSQICRVKNRKNWSSV
jgi:hypothetical protein